MTGWYLELPGDGDARRVPLEGEVVTLGRADSNTVAFPSDHTVSRLHAVLEHDGAGWSIRDAGSSNGTFVNEEPLRGERVLAPGDEIGLGSIRAVIRSADRPAVGYLDLTEEWRDRASGGAVAARPEPEPEPEPAPVAPRAPERRPADAPTQPVARGSGHGHVRGVARNVQTRRTEENKEILVFRVERYDDAGNRLAPVAVEFSGYRGGLLGDGEEVEVSGRWSRGTLRAKRVTNLSTTSELRGMPAWMKVAGAVFTVAFFTVFGLIVYTIITA